MMGQSARIHELIISRGESDMKKIIQFFIVMIISFGIIGGCGGGGTSGEGSGGELAGETNCSDKMDNDGDGEMDCLDIDCILDPACPTCEEIVEIFCDKEDECGFMQGDECIADFVFNKLGNDCEEFLAEPFTDECMKDINNIECDAFVDTDEPRRVYDDLPDSCGDEFVAPEGIQVPPGACEDLILSICDRVVECNIVTFDECILELRFFYEEVAGIDCRDVSGSETLDECIEDLDDFDCDLIGDAIVPDSCIGVLVEDSPSPPSTPSQLECLDGECTFFVIDPLCPENNCGLFPGFLPSSIGSVANADFNCQWYADYHSIPGTYLAWISDSNTSPNERFHKATVPYVNTRGEKLADNYADLTDGSTLDAVILDQEGDWGWTSAWTGTNSDGTPTGFNCRDWTSADSSDLGTSGLPWAYDDLDWSNNFNVPTQCNFIGVLYCVEQ
jgi:hypothetical protein